VGTNTSEVILPWKASNRAYLDEDGDGNYTTCERCGSTFNNEFSFYLCSPCKDIYNKCKKKVVESQEFTEKNVKTVSYIDQDGDPVYEDSCIRCDCIECDCKAYCGKCSKAKSICKCERCESCGLLPTGDDLDPKCTCQKCDRCDELPISCECEKCNNCENLIDDCTCEYCDYCDLELHHCECEWCEYCDYHLENCRCDICPHCGEREEYHCECIVCEYCNEALDEYENDCSYCTKDVTIP
jgi:protocadherin alpha